MTQEEKQLLIKDLCARLPYSVKVNRSFVSALGYVVNEDIELDTSDIDALTTTDIRWSEYKQWIVKPYLRPMSSMTDEEREKWADLFNLELDKLNEIDDEDKAEELAPYYFGKSHQVSIDWLNSHHFDYRGLIEKGLALEAPEGMYTT